MKAKKAKILIQSDKHETYVNVMAALCHKYDIKQIMLSFIDKKVDDAFINKIQSKLISLSSNPIYSKTSRISLKGETASNDHSILVRGWDILDVTGVSKK